MKKAAVYNPYFDTIGGGEVYTASVIECLSNNNFAVDIFWYSEKVKSQIQIFHGININKSQIHEEGYNLFSKKSNWLKKKRLTQDYDLFFFLSDGSIPWIFSKNNILHFQVPFQNTNGKSLTNTVKLNNIHKIVCNSQFTKQFIDKEYNVNSKVVYPPINIDVKKRRKENIILSVGRFTDTLHNKRQDILISAFKELVDEGIKDWKLKLIGSAKEGKEIVSTLKKKVEKYQVEILTDIDHRQLEKEYAKAKIFWHAAGYKVDQENNPELVEHFGIATVEAMSAGCVPVVINKGGQPEIVQDGKNGFLWNTTDQLKKFTLELVSNEKTLENLSTNAQKTSQQFSKQNFCNNFNKLSRNTS